MSFASSKQEHALSFSYTHIIIIRKYTKTYYLRKQTAYCRSIKASSIFRATQDKWLYIQSEIQHLQNKRRHKIKQQRRKIETLFKDLSICISCLLILGLVLPLRGYANKFASDTPNILVDTISPNKPITGLTKLVIAAPPR
ncbi:hypothetical protein MtrunA17_Chr8g0360021 [Medicago truncatula]|uniref:Transmembrane protein n=1 Tax=Medicago truncatula TaxID=3880 RepID=A0A396GMV7_MEDTR|nr:hypothetical protein MtrunA17_Chr8g0360021 [Medicago truncatula]